MFVYKPVLKVHKLLQSLSIFPATHAQIFNVKIVGNWWFWSTFDTIFKRDILVGDENLKGKVAPWIDYSNLLSCSKSISSEWEIKIK